MTNDYDKIMSAAGLCRSTEEQLKAKASEAVFYPSGDEKERLLHDPQIHQIDPEMRNLELRQARDEAETALKKYTDLYDFAPVGYFTIKRDGTISTVNLNGALLLGIERARLIGRRFEQFVADTDLHAFASFLDALFTSQDKGVYEIALLNERRLPLIVQLEAMADASGQECRLVLIDVTERRQAGDDLRSYSRRLIEMEENLRKKLAAELHDEIGRDLTVISMNLAFISNSLTDEASRNLSEKVQDSGTLIRGITHTVRGIMAGLRPPMLDDFGLLATLRWHSDLFSKRTGIVVSVQVDELFPRLAVEKETALFRISQEALMNAAKYADTQIVTVRLRIVDGKILFTVTDEGNGFIPASSENIQEGSGWGMKIMRERAELIGGSFHVVSVPGKGTTLSVNVPLEEV